MTNWNRRLIGAPHQVRQWLCDQGSLTQRLRSRCRDFVVCDLRQYRASALPDEVGVPSKNTMRYALMRDVWLCCGGQRQVFAHSVLPNASLQGVWRQLSRLGDRPLGAQLFSDYRIRRGGMQFCRLPVRHPLYTLAARSGVSLPPRAWARRSLFMLGQRKILVTEVFMTEMFAC